MGMLYLRDIHHQWELGDEGLGIRGIGMRTEESDSELLEDEEDEVVRLEKMM